MPDNDKLIAAFEHMVDQVGQSIHEAEEALEPTIDEMVKNAEILARELYSLNEEEAASLSATLKRDMEKANQVLNQQGKEIQDWLSFDLQLLEDRFIDMIGNASDKTWLDFRAFENENHQASLYNSGEVCNAGTLCCTKCDNNIALAQSSIIPPCPTCAHREFYRVIG